VKSGDIYVKISKSGRLVILMANEVWLNYKFSEFNLKDMPLWQKKRLCWLIHDKFKDKKISNCASYTKNMVRDVLVEAIIQFYSTVK